MGLFDGAIEFANRTPCDPKTLTRAARDFAERRPEFAIEAGLAALRWLAEGYGYEITGRRVGRLREHEEGGGEGRRVGEVRDGVRALVATETYGERFVTRVLGRDLGL